MGKALKRQPLNNKVNFDFTYEGDPSNNPKPTLITGDAVKQYDFGELDCIGISQAILFKGDVYLKDQYDIVEFAKGFNKDVVLIDGNLTIENRINADCPVIFVVTGDLRCDVLETDEPLDGLIKGNIYAKYAIVHHNSGNIFICEGQAITPYFFSDDDRQWIFPNKDSIAINYEGRCDGRFKADYMPKDFKKSMVYEVFDRSYNFDRFINVVESGKNPIREFELTTKEVNAEKKRKLTEYITNKLDDVKSGKTNELEISCKLKSIPKEVFECTTLEVLNLANNNIKKIPTTIKKLKNLRVLNVKNNYGIDIDAICELENLEELNISGNAPRYGGGTEKFVLPLQLGKLKKLKKLALGGGHFENQEVLGQLENLEELTVFYGNLTSGDFNATMYVTPYIKPLKSLTKIIVDEKILSKETKKEIEKVFGHLELKMWVSK